MSAYLAWRRGPAGRADWKRLGWAGWSAATAGSAATVCFIAAFKHTAVANVLVILVRHLGRGVRVEPSER